MDKLDIFDEQEVKSLIKSLLEEKERHHQEKLAQRIGSIRNERTAELVADLLHSSDSFIRNIAIELLVMLDEKALVVLGQKLSDKDRNIRKFALDALKHIKGKQSCKIAMTALDDEDDNVVEAALEVIAQQQYKEAEDKLGEILKKTNSIWIINALIRTFAHLESRSLLNVAEEKINSMETTEIEKNILADSYVMALGYIGSYHDIDKIINKYAQKYYIDSSNLTFALINLVSRTDISKLTDETIKKLGKIFEENWDYGDPGKALIYMDAFVKLQLDFFLDDIEEIYRLHSNEEFFTEHLYMLIRKLREYPGRFMIKLLESQEPRMVLLGLKLIREKGIPGYNKMVENLCTSTDKDVSMNAIRIIAEIQEYSNVMLLESLTSYNEEADIAAIESMDETDTQTVEKLISKLEHHSPKVRKAAAQKLLLIPDRVDTELLGDIVRNNPGIEGNEALEVLFVKDAGIGWKFINRRIDCIDENVRAALVDIASWSEGKVFYDFMKTMINDPSPIVRKKAVKVLNGKINENSLSLLKKLYENETNLVNRMEIISNLHRFSGFGFSVLDVVTEAAGSSDALERIAAAQALGSLNDNKATSELQRMLHDPVEEVREAAKEALGEKRWRDDIT